MLFLVLLLVLGAFGLLIASLTTSIMALSWASAAVSALAAILLVVDAVRRRTRRRGTAGTAAKVSPDVFEEPPEAERPVSTDDSETTAVIADAPITEQSEAAEETPAEDVEAGERDEELVADDEPAIQRTSKQNAELVATLDAEVVVVDERPRYHVRECRWLGAKPILPLPAYEAVELGFTPCAVCRPDTELVRAHGSQATAGS